MQIQPFEKNHLEPVVRLSLRAWAPVFESLENVLKPEVFREFYPEGWPRSQEQTVVEACTSEEIKVWVARQEAALLGFVAVKLHRANNLGEIYLIAVDPLHQRRGIGRALTDFALAWMKEAGMSLAMVETGGDAGHAPARRTYEQAGFDLLPIARYFKKL